MINSESTNYSCFLFVQWFTKTESEGAQNKGEKRSGETNENELSEEENDELWNQMDVVTTEKAKKSKYGSFVIEIAIFAHQACSSSLVVK